jgi:hypothetical protein
LVDVVLRLAPVRNDPGVVCTPVTALENVGVTAETTVMPGAPATPLTTLVKPVFTSVTHVAAEAEDNSAAFRLATLTPSRRRRRQVMSCPLANFGTLATETHGHHVARSVVPTRTLRPSYDIAA